MGWARTLFLGDIGNRLDIADTERDISGLRKVLDRHRNKNRSQDQAIAELERENDQLFLVVAALVGTLEAKGILNQAEMERLMERIEGITE